MRWLSVHGAGWGIDPARLAVGGDSAGANLSFAAALRLRDRGEVGVVRAILSNYGYFTPEVSDRAEARFGGPGSIMDRAEAPAHYDNSLPDRARARPDPFACPIHADLTAPPPVLPLSAT